MSTPTRIHIPRREEIEHQLREETTLPDRVSYVAELLQPLFEAEHAIDVLTRDLQRAELAKEGMAIELRALRQKLGDLSSSDRSAVDQKFEMLTKLNHARGVFADFKRKAHRELDEMLATVDKTLAK